MSVDVVCTTLRGAHQFAKDEIRVPVTPYSWISGLLATSLHSNSRVLRIYPSEIKVYKYLLYTGLFRVLMWEYSAQTRGRHNRLPRPVYPDLPPSFWCCCLPISA